MKKNIKILDVVALIHDNPDHGLIEGQVGTVVEILKDNVFEVEFSDDQGRAYEILAIEADELIVLHYAPVATA